MTIPSQNMLEFNLASEKVILFSARAHQVKTLVDDFILELKKVRVLLQGRSLLKGPGMENRVPLCHLHTSHASLRSMGVCVCVHVHTWTGQPSGLSKEALVREWMGKPHMCSSDSSLQPFTRPSLRLP